MQEYKYYGQPHGNHYLVLTGDAFDWEEIEVNEQKCLYIVLGDDHQVRHLILKLEDLV